MATVIFEGQATAVAQVETFQVTTYDAGGTYVLTVGISPYTFVVSVVGDTDEDTTATNLAAAWNGAVHPYCLAATATVATDTVTLTADTAGAPFTVTGSASGGAAAMGAGTITTASDGPNQVDSANNYRGGALPSAADNMHIAPDAPNLCWGLDDQINDLTLLQIPEGTFNIGLNEREFATSADGATTDSSAPEYRMSYWRFNADKAYIGRQLGSTPVTSPSTRLNLWNLKTGGITNVYTVRGSSIDTGFPTLKFGASNSDTDFYIFEATGGVGWGVEEASRPTSVGSIFNLSKSSATKLYTGIGSSINVTYEQSNGEATFILSGNTTCIIHGGILRARDQGSNAFKFTALTINGGIVYVQNQGGSSIVADTINGNGGTVDLTQAVAGSTITTLNPKVGFTLVGMDDNYVVTTTNKATGPHTISWT